MTKRRKEGDEKMWDYRRFDLITDSVKQIEAFEKMCKEKGLSREHLVLILSTVKLNPNADTAKLLRQAVLQDFEY